MGDIRWPDGKKCAVMFTFDVDGDTTWENGNRGLKNGEKYIKSLSVGQYGPKRCVDRILQKLDQYGVKAEYGSFANLDFTHKLIIANGSGFKWQ